ncbi:hypothetical protein Tco_1556538 [Tanacetum coccineum]
MHDAEEIVDIHEDSDSDLLSMPDDDLRSVSGFDTADSDDTHKNKVSLHLKLRDMESFIVQQVSAEFKSSLPSLVSNTLKEQLPSFLSNALKDSLPQLFKDSIKSSVLESIAKVLSHVEAQVQKNLQDQLPNLLLKPMYKEFNAFNKLESQRFVLLQKELSKSLHKNMRKSIRLKVKKGIKEVRDKLSFYASTVASNSQHVQDLRVMFKDIVSLLKAAEVIKKANAEGVNIVDIVQGEQPSAQVVLNEGKALVFHNP